MHEPVATEQPASPTTTEPNTKIDGPPSDYIAMADCHEGMVYAVHSEEMSVAVYDGDGGFVGLPDGNKGGFLIYAKHVDDGGDVYPCMDFELLPQGMEPTIFLTHHQGCLWSMRYDRYIPVLRRKERPSDPPHGERGGWVDLYVDTHVRIPHDKYPFMLGNQSLINYLSEYEMSP